MTRSRPGDSSRAGTASSSATTSATGSCRTSSFHVVVRIKNGDFLPTFTVDGFVAGSWMVETTRGEAVLTLSPAVPVASRSVRAELTEEAERLVRVVAAEASRHEVRWTDG